MHANFCEQCGSKLSLESKYCENCGHKIDLDSIEKVGKPADSILKNETGNTEKADKEDKADKADKANKAELKTAEGKKAKNKNKVLCLVLAILLFSIFIWLLTLKDDEKKPGDDPKVSATGHVQNNSKSDLESQVLNTGIIGNSNGNRANLGFAVAADSEVIYCNDLGINGAGGGTLITNIDGTNSRPFLSELCVTLDFDGEWIYYSRYIMGKGIFKIRPDNTDKTKIANDEIAYLCVSGDWIYYVDSNYLLHRMQKDGSSNSIIYDKQVEFVNIKEDKIYYIEGIGGKGLISQIGTDGSQKKQLLSDIANMLIYDNEWLYYINVSDNNNVYRVRADGSGKEKIFNKACNAINIDNGWLYYTPYGNKGLHKIKFDGTDARTFLDDEDCTIFNIVGDKLYCVVYEDGENEIFMMEK